MDNVYLSIAAILVIVVCLIFILKKTDNDESENKPLNDLDFSVDTFRIYSVLFMAIVVLIVSIYSLMAPSND